MTKRLRPTSALLDVEQHLRLFIEGVRDYAVITMDIEGNVRSWNDGARAIKGYEANEILGRNFRVFYTAEEVAAGKPDACLREAAAKGRAKDQGMRVRKDGTRFLAEVVITPIVDKLGKHVGFGKITRDVTDRPATEDSLRLSEARLQALVDTVLDTLVDGLIIIDRRGQMQLYNRACESLFGYSPDEVIGKNVKMLMPPELSREHDQYLLNYQNTRIRKIIGISREVTGQRKDGSTFPMHLAVGEATHLGEPIYVGVIRDLTARNRTEAELRQSQKMEIVGQLTGGLAHDFNNILMVIRANTEALQEDPGLGPRALERTKQIERSAQRAADLTRQLLAFSRRQPLQPRPTNLNDVVGATSRLMKRTLGEEIEIETVLGTDLWITNVDRTQIESALVNLCVNARDAMPKGGRLLIETRNVVLEDDYVALNPDAVAGDYVMMAVTDTGMGILTEHIDKIFEPFFTTKEVGQGTGLGLSMVYGFIKQSNGHIKVYSEVGRGTSMKVYLRRASETPFEDAVESAAPIPLGAGRILVVEDDAQVRASVVEQARNLGYVVDEAASGAAGLAAFETAGGRYNLLLTDVVMPGPLSGKALADEISRRWPGTPVVFMSGYTENAIVHHGRLDPGVRLLAKPFGKRDLAEMIHQTLAEAKAAKTKASVRKGAAAKGGKPNRRKNVRRPPKR